MSFLSPSPITRPSVPSLLDRVPPSLSLWLYLTVSRPPPLSPPSLTFHFCHHFTVFSSHHCTLNTLPLSWPNPRPRFLPAPLCLSHPPCPLLFLSLCHPFTVLQFFPLLFLPFLSVSTTLSQWFIPFPSFSLHLSFSPFPFPAPPSPRPRQ